MNDTLLHQEIAQTPSTIDMSEISVEELSSRCLLIIGFFIKKYPDEKVFLEAKRIVDDTILDQDIAGLKHLYRDLNTWAKGLKKEEIVELNSLLTELDETNIYSEKLTGQTIRDVLQKKKISSQNELAVIQDYLADATEFDLYFTETIKLEALINQYLNDN